MSNVDRTRIHAAVSAVAAAEQQPEGWCFVPDTILLGYQWAPQWVPARTPTVHCGPISGKAVGGSNTVQHSSTVQKHGKHFFHFVFFFVVFAFFFLRSFSCFFLFYFLLAFLFIFDGSLHSGRSKVTRVTVGRDTNQSLRVCKLNLATLKVAITEKLRTENQKKKRKTRNSARIFGRLTF